MHEVGIVNGILDTVIRAARGAGASRARFGNASYRGYDRGRARGTRLCVGDVSR